MLERADGVEGDQRIKGSVINGHLKFIKKKWGAAGVEGACKELRIDCTRIEENRWYDADYSNKILTWIARNKGVDQVVACGAHTVKDLGILSYIVRFMNMRSMVAKAKENYSDAFSYGRVKVEIDGDSALVIMKDVARSEYTCLAWRGVFEGMLEMTKTPGKVEEVKCQFKGAPRCEFIVDWSEEARER